MGVQPRHEVAIGKQNTPFFFGMCGIEASTGS